MKNTLSFFALMLGIMCLATCGCKEDNSDPNKEELGITGIFVPAAMDAEMGGEITLTGKGFAMGDKIRLVLTTDESIVYTQNVTAVAANSVTFGVPQGLTTGKYSITVVRGEQTLLLGTTTFTLAVNTTVPDQDGKNVKGLVHSNGVGIAGVVVSDGYEVTTTNAEGIYYLASEKKTGYVFISIPSNYEVAGVGNAPQFFQRLTKGADVVEQKDFSLTPVNNENHVVLALADMHLANRNDDIAQFDKFVADANTLITAYKAGGAKVYGLTLGDQTWDLYWYERSFALPQYLQQQNKINCSVFNTMGNHDNDPYVANDWGAEQPFRSIIGPTYYSFNLGKIHYVVLDNILYTNANGAQGFVGNREYNATITTDQIEWLKKDLALVADKSTPVVVAMHVQLYKEPNVSNSVTNNLTNTAAFVTAVSAFSTVHVLSGHTHINYAVKPSATLMEHNTAAICATWWWTGRSGYANNHICRDGSVGGYGVWEMNNTDIKWYYKSIDYPKDYQFRSYDLNTVHITAAAHAPSANAAYAAKLPAIAGTYAAANANNEVLINVWGYEPDWTVEVSEGAAPLTVTRVSAKDPLHIISYEAKRLNANADPTSSFTTINTTHFFKVQASSPTSTLLIKVTDHFGNVYTENMTRPKAFTYTMR